MPRPDQPRKVGTLGGFISEARKHKKLTLTQLAGKDYSVSLISQIERDLLKEPSDSVLEYLAERLDLSIGELKNLRDKPLDRVQKLDEATSLSLAYLKKRRKKLLEEVDEIDEIIAKIENYFIK
ncbi:MAG TPA: helix-turn-helix transcriptional regulator [Candidatus Saccharimonadales bacterium]|nr:helix-turn-helix transcriptional regulator [Candidatus Saccharimonadales bacterium]